MNRVQNIQSIPSDGVLAAGRWQLVADHNADILVKEGAKAELVVTDAAADVAIAIRVERSAELRIVHAVKEEGSTTLTVSLNEGAQCRVTEVVLKASQLNVVANLEEAYARFELDGAFILTGEEKGSVKVDVNHRVSDCSSRTSFKGVASGNASGRFSGIVYVAPDAQRTDSEQSSRNVVVGDAHIETLPQLEIYADDVKCSHGATVGQMDSDAIFYMRQRGLSLVDAKRLQIEGFVSDVAMHSSIEECAEMLQEMIDAKLETL